MDRPRRTALYARALTDDPEDGLSWDSQLSCLREYAEVPGVEVYAEYVDIGPSKTHSFTVTLTIPETSNRRKHKVKARRPKKTPDPKPTKKPTRNALANPNAKKNITPPDRGRKAGSPDRV